MRLQIVQAHRIRLAKGLLKLFIEGGISKMVITHNINQMTSSKLLPFAAKVLMFLFRGFLEMFVRNQKAKEC